LAVAFTRRVSGFERFPGVVSRHRTQDPFVWSEHNRRCQAFWGCGRWMLLIWRGGGGCEWDACVLDKWARQI
jgi:hypothetical protein